MQMKVFRKISLVAGAVALMTATLGGPAAQADAGLTGAPGGVITVDVVTVNGSGCPQGSADASVSGDNTSFAVTYERFQAEAGAAPMSSTPARTARSIWP
ncbi:hypothetical protein GCM10029992_33230 [Glycomyces albus]